MKTFNYLEDIQKSFWEVLASLKEKQKIDTDDKKITKKDRDRIAKDIESLKNAASEGAAMYEAATKAKKAGITDEELNILIATAAK